MNQNLIFSFFTAFLFLLQAGTKSLPAAGLPVEADITALHFQLFMRLELPQTFDINTL